MKTVHLPEENSQDTVASIDFAKWIGAVFVIAMHTGLLKEVTVLGAFVLNFLTRLAVPFFFVSSGYFLFGKMQWEDSGRLKGWVENGKRLLRYEKRLVILYCGWSVVFLFWTIPQWYCIGWWGMDALKDYVVAFFLSGTLYHFWYLLASIYGAAACYMVLHLFRGKQCLTVMGIAWGLYLLTYSYAWLPVPVLPELLALTGRLGNVQTGLLCAMPLMSLGAMAARYPARTDRKRRLELLALFCLLTLGEIYCLWRFSPNQTSLSYGIFTLPTAWYLFQWIRLDWKMPEWIQKRAGLFRRLSVDLYCVHALIWNVLGLFMGNAHSVLCFLTVLTCSMAVSLALDWGRGHRKTR